MEQVEAIEVEEEELGLRKRPAPITATETSPDDEAIAENQQVVQVAVERLVGLEKLCALPMDRRRIEHGDPFGGKGWIRLVEVDVEPTTLTLD